MQTSWACRMIPWLELRAGPHASGAPSLSHSLRVPVAPSVIVFFICRTSLNLRTSNVGIWCHYPSSGHRVKSLGMAPWGWLGTGMVVNSRGVDWHQLSGLVSQMGKLRPTKQVRGRVLIPAHSTMPVVSHSNCPHGDHLAQILHLRVGSSGGSQDLWHLFLPGLGDSALHWLLCDLGYTYPLLRLFPHL